MWGIHLKASDLNLESESLRQQWDLSDLVKNDRTEWKAAEELKCVFISTLNVPLYSTCLTHALSSVFILFSLFRHYFASVLLLYAALSLSSPSFVSPSSSSPLPSSSSLASLYFRLMSKCLISAELWLMPSPLVLTRKISPNFSGAPALPSLSLRLSFAVARSLLSLSISLIYRSFVYSPASHLLIFLLFDSLLRSLSCSLSLSLPVK